MPRVHQGNGSHEKRRIKARHNTASIFALNTPLQSSEKSTSSASSIMSFSTPKCTTESNNMANNTATVKQYDGVRETTNVEVASTSSATGAGIQQQQQQQQQHVTTIKTSSKANEHPAPNPTSVATGGRDGQQQKERIGWTTIEIPSSSSTTQLHPNNTTQWQTKSSSLNHQQHAPPRPQHQQQHHLESHLRNHLATTGETDRIQHQLHAQLTECGWRDAMTNRAKELIRQKGLTNVTMDELVMEMNSVGRAMVPMEVKGKVVDRLEAVLRNDGCVAVGGVDGGAGAPLS